MLVLLLCICPDYTFCLSLCFACLSLSVSFGSLDRKEAKKLLTHRTFSSMEDYSGYGEGEEDDEEIMEVVEKALKR